MIGDLSFEIIVGLIVAALVATCAYLGRRLAATRAALSADRKLHRRLRDAGLSNFYASRAEYSLYRGAPTLLDYLSRARTRAVVAGYWMSQGSEMEGVAAGLGGLLRSNPNIRIDIVVVDPTAPYIGAVASHMRMTKAEVVGRVRGTLRELAAMSSGLGPAEASRFTIGLHTSYPISSIIALDPENSDAKIQVDFKPYGTPRSRSFTFEFGGCGPAITDLLWSSCRQLVADATRFDPAKHLR